MVHGSRRIEQATFEVKVMRHQMIGISVAALVLAGGAAPAFAQDAKAAEILAAAQKAIGGTKLDALKGLSVQASVQRNVGSMQMQTETELLLEMPDKYVRSDVSSGMMNMTMSAGFNGDRAILPAGATAASGGGMIIRMGGGAAMHADPHGAEKPTPEQLEQMNSGAVRNARQEVSRLMLGWFAMPHPSLKAQYTYAGEAESPDGKAYVIDVKDEDGFAARLFIDQNSKLPLMLTYKGRQARMVTRTRGPQVTTTQGRPQQLSEEEAKRLRETAVAPAPMADFSLFFEDWREVDGVNFPHVVRRASEGATNEEWKVNKVTVNPKIDAKKFAVEAR
jgi:hypothetical protein